MSFVRFTIGLLFVSALLFTAARGVCAEQNTADNIDRQIAERTKQYQESLRQRAAGLSPSLRAKIESQARRTVAKGLTQWKSGELDIQIALPRLAAAQRVARFIVRHLPFSGSPFGSFAFGIGTYPAALTVTSVQHGVKKVLKAFIIPIADSVVLRSSIVPQNGGGILSYFVRVVGTIILRR
jgi:hypothetical protein